MALESFRVLHLRASAIRDGLTQLFLTRALKPQRVDSRVQVSTLLTLELGTRWSHTEPTWQPHGDAVTRAGGGVGQVPENSSGRQRISNVNSIKPPEMCRNLIHRISKGKYF